MLPALVPPAPVPPALSPPLLLPLSPLHVNQCNALLQRLFWSGINIGDCVGLKRGIVALYRKLVVGVGVMTPDGYMMYLAVRPHWENEGIGRMMLWWLVKENESVDITLHVAADNPALVNYTSLKLLTWRSCISHSDSKARNILSISMTNFTNRVIGGNEMPCF